jgi:hypothetical protein
MWKHAFFSDQPRNTSGTTSIGRAPGGVMRVVKGPKQEVLW